MEAATSKRNTAGGQEQASDVSIKLGALMLRCLGGRGGDAFRVVDESGLSFGQLKALIELERPDTKGTVTALAEELGVSAASASRAADGLVRRKLATRVEDADDRRVRRLALTQAGRELAERIISARLAGLEEFTGSLEPDERKKLEATLDTLLERPELAEIYASYEKRVRK